MSETTTKAVYRDALPAGTVLNGYTIRHVLGRGGFGTTYYATDQLDQQFAIKEYFPKQFATRQGLEVIATSESEEASFDDCRERFLAEAKILSLLTKTVSVDSIVKVVTFFQAHGTAYIVMEFLTGESLDEVMRRNPKGLPGDQLESILRAVLAALDKVHEAGLVHRDIKPGNVFIHESGRPILIDFGSARKTSQNQNTVYTQIYSGGYAPIEQFAGNHQGPFSDIYAVGAMCYRLIGGTLIDSFTRHQAVIRQKPDPLLPALQVGAARYPVGLLRVIDVALTIDAEDRPQSAKELLAMLDGTKLPADDATVISRPGSALDWDATRIAPPSRPATVIAPEIVPQPIPVAAQAAAPNYGTPPPPRVTGTAAVATKKGSGGRILAIAAVILLLLCGAAGAFYYRSTLMSDSGDTEAWNGVVAAPTLAAYQDYIAHYPQGQHHAEASDKLLALLKAAADERAAADKTAADKAATDQMATEWNAIGSSGTTDQLTAFQAHHPGSPYDADIQQRLAVLRADQVSHAQQDPAAAWNAVKNSDQPDALQGFLTQYPDSPNAPQARDKLAEVQHRAAIRAQIQQEGAAWRNVQSSNSPDDIRAFLAQYPDGPNSLNAKSRLAKLTGGGGSQPATADTGQSAADKAQQEQALSQWISQSKQNGAAMGSAILSNPYGASGILRQGGR